LNTHHFDAIAMSLTIRQKLLLSFGLLLALLLTLAAVDYLKIRELRETLNRTQSKEAYLGRAQAALWEVRFIAPQLIAITDPEARNKLIASEPALHEAIDRDLAIYGRLEGLSPEEIAGHKKLTEIVVAYRERRRDLAKLIIEGKTEEAAQWRVQHTTPLGESTVKGISELIALTQRKDIERRAIQDHAADSVRYLTLAIGALTLLVGAVAATLVLRSLTRPIKRLLTVLGQLTEGDYTARVKLATKDELGQVGQALDQLLDERLEAIAKQADENERLNDSIIGLLQTVVQLSNKDLTARAPVTEDVVGTVSSSINQLSHETGQALGEVQQIANSVRQTSEHVVAQATQVDATARAERQALKEMSERLAHTIGQLGEVAALSQNSSQAATQAAAANDAAMRTVDATVRGMDTLRESISEMDKRFKRLGERSQEISSVVGLINTISERTHVLAMNASMQAATAGEAGRGFAVVAEEVQRLSENARQATGQISQLVHNIQSETSDTVFMMNRLIELVVKQSERAQDAGAQMVQTRDTTSALVGLVKQIAAFSHQQGELAQQLRQSVAQLNDGALTTSEAIASQNLSTSTLLTFARRLTETVGQFKLSASVTNLG
jgi:methyl-accepting chemotaxis protein